MTLNERMTQKETMAHELDRYRDCDPQAMEELRSQIQVALDAANRWTGQLTYFTLNKSSQVFISPLTLCPPENIFTVRTWCRDRFNIPENEIDKQFGIPDDLDYL